MLREERGAGVVGMRAAGSRGSAKAPLLLAVAAISLAGCSIVDLYSERATVYNVESEQAHDQGILLNIVRASMRRPRAYTLVQKITGQATATGAATLNFPFGPRISGSNTAAVTGGASGGPTFEVATLETSDFFQSLLLPIPASLFDLYIQGEFPRDLLFNLFIEKIVMRRADGECGALNHLRTCEIVFQNYPGRRLQLELFQALAGYLVDLNLSTQPIKQQNKPKAPAESKPGSGDRKDKTQTDAPVLPGEAANSFETVVLPIWLRVDNVGKYFSKFRRNDDAFDEDTCACAHQAQGKRVAPGAQRSSGAVMLFQLARCAFLRLSVAVASTVPSATTTP
jgi:hypothetical protein